MDEQQLRQYFAAHTLTGVLSSPTWSSTLLSMKAEEPEPNDDETADAKHVLDTLARIVWNIADAMMVEGRERGHIDAS